MNTKESMEINITEKSISDEETVWLIEEAFKARKAAYAPYSHYHVGAALLTVGGKIYHGANIENASYGASNCAERTAIFAAVNKGERKFVAIAIVGALEGEEPTEYAFPCGICRQVMQEFMEHDFRIIVAKNVNDYKCYTLAELLPEGFGGNSIV